MRAASVRGLPQWASALQGLAYWIGWNHTRYPYWPLTEGALVGELQRLIASAIPSNQFLRAEVDFNELCGHHAARVSESDQFRTGRADLVIVKNGKNRTVATSDVHSYAVALIEVKRSENSWTEIKKDIVRLARLSKY